MTRVLLNQFGSVLTYAIELESKNIEYYQNPKLRLNFPDLVNEFESRIKLAQSHIKNLERSRRENITEITLEPIEGLESDNYHIDQVKFNLEEIEANHRSLYQFYDESGPKINVLETKRLFQKCCSNHKNILEKRLES